jgi:hypothetical protein
LALRYGLPTLYVLLLPVLWSDSGACRDWEFFEVPEDTLPAVPFVRRK